VDRSNTRNTLVAILTALTAGVVVGASAAKLTITKRMLEHAELGRYAKAIQLQQRLLKKNAELKAYLTEADSSREAVYSDWYRNREDKQYSDPKAVLLYVEVNAIAAELVEYTMVTFDPNGRTRTQFSREEFLQLSDLFDGWLVIDTLSIDDLKRLLDTIIPTAILRQMIGAEKCMLNTMDEKFGPVLQDFAFRFKRLIFQDGLHRPTDTETHEHRIATYPEYAELAKHYNYGYYPLRRKVA
jgi:hypothetical protein